MTTKSMDAIECIFTRRSIRKYKDKPIPWDDVIKILEAGKYAPTAGNLQNFVFIAVREEEHRKKLAEACCSQKWMEKAPVHIIIVGEPAKAKRFYGTRGERLYTIQNCAAAVENMLLTANALGYGSCWVGAFDEDMIRRLIVPPEDVIVYAVVTVGYADEAPESPPKYRIEHKVFLESWGQKKKIPAWAMGWTSAVTMKKVKDTKRFFSKLGEKIKGKK